MFAGGIEREHGFKWGSWTSLDEVLDILPEIQPISASANVTLDS